MLIQAPTPAIADIPAILLRFLGKDDFLVFILLRLKLLLALPLLLPNLILLLLVLLAVLVLLLLLVLLALAVLRLAPLLLLGLGLALAQGGRAAGRVPGALAECRPRSPLRELADGLLARAVEGGKTRLPHLRRTATAVAIRGSGVALAKWMDRMSERMPRPCFEVASESMGMAAVKEGAGLLR